MIAYKSINYMKIIYILLEIVIGQNQQIQIFIFQIIFKNTLNFRMIEQKQQKREKKCTNKKNGIAKKIKFKSKKCDYESEQHTSQQQARGDIPTKHRANKLEPYVKVLRCIHEMHDDQNDARNPLNNLTATAFWYFIGAEYYYLSHFNNQSRRYIKRQIIRKIEGTVNNVIVPCRFQKKKINRNPYQQLRVCQTIETRQQSQKLGALVEYFFYFNPQKTFPIKETKSSITIQGYSSFVEDYSFLSSTISTLYNIIIAELRNNMNYGKVLFSQLNNLEEHRITIGWPFPRDLDQHEIFEDDYEQQKEIVLSRQNIFVNMILELPLEFVIDLLEQSIPKYKYPDVEEHFDITQEQLYSEQDNPSNFVSTFPPEQQRYIQYMKQKQKETGIRIAQPIHNELQRQDYKCQICYVGDYQPGNLIVLCSLCNIAVHQLCVYLQVIPQNNWICQVCEEFGPAGVNLPCPMCPNHGGAMKKSNIQLKYYKCQRNQKYSDYKKYCQISWNHKKFVTEQMRTRQDIPLLYDYFKPQTYSNEIPKTKYIWAHSSCININNQCYYKQQNDEILAMGIQNIPSQRFSYICQICQQRSGVGLKCKEPDCQTRFHAECANRNKLVFELIDRDKIIYNIFCSKHSPLHLQQKSKQKRKNYQDQIRKFASSIVKYVGFQKFPSRLPTFHSENKSRPKYEQPKKIQIVMSEFNQQVQDDGNENHSSIKQERHFSQQVNYEASKQSKKIIKGQTKENNLFIRFIKKMDQLQSKEQVQQIINSNAILPELVGIWQRHKIKQTKDQSLLNEFKKVLQVNKEARSQINTLIKILGKNSTRYKKIQSNIKQKKAQLYEDDGDDKMSVQVLPKHKKMTFRQKDIEQDQENIYDSSHTPRNQSIKIDQNKGILTGEKYTDDKKLSTMRSNRKPRIIADQISSQQQKINQHQISYKKKSKPLKKKEARNKRNDLKRSKPNQNKQIRPKESKQEVDVQFKNVNTINTVNQNKKTTLRHTQQLYCLCKSPYDPSFPMIQCQNCMQWFHFSCIGFKSSDKVAKDLKYLCLNCIQLETIISRKKILMSYVDHFRQDSLIYKSYQKEFSHLITQKNKEFSKESSQSKKTRNSKDK